MIPENHLHPYRCTIYFYRLVFIRSFTCFNVSVKRACNLTARTLRLTDIKFSLFSFRLTPFIIYCYEIHVILVAVNGAPSFTYDCRVFFNLIIRYLIIERPLTHFQIVGNIAPHSQVYVVDQLISTNYNAHPETLITYICFSKTLLPETCCGVSLIHLYYTHIVI